MEKRLGKITNVRFGLGGYQDCQFGLSLCFESKNESWGVNDFIAGGWSISRDCDSPFCKWTEKDRDDGFAKMVRRINQLLIDAKIDDVAKLKGKPVEVMFDGNCLKEWRILTEVL